MRDQVERLKEANMARISVDLDQISKNLKHTADKAKTQLTQLAKRVEKDLGDNPQVQKLVEEGLKLVTKANKTATQLRKEVEKRFGKRPEEFVKKVYKSVSHKAKSVKKKSPKREKHADSHHVETT
jgi:vacuolar-type H+-ATPase subunit H